MSRSLDGATVLAFLPRLWPTWGAGTQRSTAIASGLVRAGARLVAIVPVNERPSGRPPEELDGAELRFIPSQLSRLPWQLLHALKCTGLTDEHVPAHRLAAKSVRSVNCDAVIASGPPWSAAVAAAGIALHQAVPLLIDLRDEWSTNPFQTKLGPVYHWRDRTHERETLRHAEVLTAPYGTPLEDLRSSVAARKVVIPHGADVLKIASCVHSPSPERRPFRLLFAGARYGMVNEGPFLRALARRPPAEPVELRLVGSDRRVSEAPPSNVTVTVEGPVPHDRLMAEYDAAQALLALAPSRRGHLWVPSKLPEYSATGRPILAFGERGSSLLDLVGGLPGGHAAPDGDDDAFERALESLADDVASGIDHRSVRHLRSWDECGDDFADVVQSMIGRI